MAALALASPASAQHLPPIERAASVGKAGGNPRLSAANTMIVSLPPGSGPVAKYPLLFGRPFLVGAVPSGRCPVVAVNGVAVPTQADIKNRYPDGSAKYAVIAIQPDIAALGRLTLTFGPGACNNAPLTQAQMLGPNYNFDAQIRLCKVRPPSMDRKHRIRSCLIGPPLPMAAWRPRSTARPTS